MMKPGDVVRITAGFLAGELAIVVKPAAVYSDGGQPIAIVRLMGRSSPFTIAEPELRLMTKRRKDGLWT